MDGSRSEVLCDKREFHVAYSHAQGEYEEIGLCVKSLGYDKARLECMRSFDFSHPLGDHAPWRG